MTFIVKIPVLVFEGEKETVATADLRVTSPDGSTAEDVIAALTVQLSSALQMAGMFLRPPEPVLAEDVPVDTVRP